MKREEWWGGGGSVGIRIPQDRCVEAGEERGGARGAKRSSPEFHVWVTLVSTTVPWRSVVHVSLSFSYSRGLTGVGSGSGKPEVGSRLPHFITHSSLAHQMTQVLTPLSLDGLVPSAPLPNVHYFKYFPSIWSRARIHKLT